MRWEGGGRTCEALGLAGEVHHADVQASTATCFVPTPGLCYSFHV